MSKYLTVTQYARKHHIARQTAYWRIRHWKLKTKQYGPLLFVLDTETAPK